MNVHLKGRLDLHVNGERSSLDPFDVPIIPPGVHHATRSIAGKTATLLAFFPPRYDYLDGTTDQTEFPDA